MRKGNAVTASQIIIAMFLILTMAFTGAVSEVEECIECDDHIKTLLQNLNTNISTTGNITASYFYGDGSQLTGLPSGIDPWNTSPQTVNLTTTGNITAGLFYGDGSQLNNIITYNNSYHVFVENQTNYDTAYAHVTDTGASHTYIDQDVTTTSSPTFVTLTATTLTDGTASITGGEITGASNTNWDAAYSHKTTEDALNGLVKVNGAGGYSAITDSSANWNSAYNHITESGASHTYIDQDVTTTGTPSFAEVTVDHINIDNNYITSDTSMGINTGNYLRISNDYYLKLDYTWAQLKTVAEAGNYRTIHVPSGTVSATSTITLGSGVRIIGTGKGTKFTNNAGGPVFYTEGAYNEFRGFVIDSIDTTNLRGIELGPGSYFNLVDNVRFNFDNSDTAENTEGIYDHGNGYNKYNNI